MTKFKDALDETMQGGLYIHLKYDQVSGQSMMRPMEPEHINTIRLALRIAQAVMEPSQGFPSMAQAGAAKMWDECKDGLIGHDQATAIFRAMIEQMMREIQDGSQ